jgi:hypothetical protein
MSRQLKLQPKAPNLMAISPDNARVAGKISISHPLPCYAPTDVKTAQENPGQDFNPDTAACASLEPSQSDSSSMEATKTSQSADLSEPIALITRLIQKEIRVCAQHIGIEVGELQAWIDLQLQVPAKSILSLLRIAKQYDLDPLKEEIVLTQYEDQWHASISIDAWIKIINRHPAFTGITFSESPEQDQGLPIWMECAIYRSDRSIPTTTREYLIEVKNNSDIWKRMPRRMLRHRALQQCARLAMGITIGDQREALDKTEAVHLQMNPPVIKSARETIPSQTNRTAVLKQLLQSDL